MRIIINESTMIVADAVHSVMVTGEDEKTKVLKSPGFLGLFPTYQTITTRKYKLVVSYTRDKTSWTWSASHSNYDVLAKMSKHIIAQVKANDSSYVDQAFEDVVLKGK